mmetsp:Transcript_5655/g.16813  ORF Transcript_5655/g.16813 Transcript_5655/m.16813 type:complete len:373 (-) Transcript_5655:145-1263(-)
MGLKDAKMTDAERQMQMRARLERWKAERQAKKGHVSSRSVPESTASAESSRRRAVPSSGVLTRRPRAPAPNNNVKPGQRRTSLQESSVLNREKTVSAQGDSTDEHNCDKENCGTKDDHNCKENEQLQFSTPARPKLAGEPERGSSVALHLAESPAIRQEIARVRKELLEARKRKSELEKRLHQSRMPAAKSPSLSTSSGSGESAASIDLGPPSLRMMDDPILDQRLSKGKCTQLERREAELRKLVDEEEKRQLERIAADVRKKEKRLHALMRKRVKDIASLATKHTIEWIKQAKRKHATDLERRSMLWSDDAEAQVDSLRGIMNNTLSQSHTVIRGLRARIDDAEKENRVLLSMEARATRSCADLSEYLRRP